MRALVIVAIVMVAVIMGVSAVAPAMADHGGPNPPQAMCDALFLAIANVNPIPPGLASLFVHCIPS